MRERFRFRSCRRNLRKVSKFLILHVFFRSPTLGRSRRELSWALVSDCPPSAHHGDLLRVTAAVAACRRRCRRRAPSSGKAAQAKASQGEPAKTVLPGGQRPPRQGERRTVRVVRLVPAPPSVGQLAGLHATDDPLDLKSSVALVIDQDTDQVLFSKNPAGGAADRVAHQADDRAGRHRSRPAAGRGADDRPGRRRHRKGQPLASARGHAAHPRRDAAPGADVVREPRCARAGPPLSRAAWTRSSPR